MPRFDPYFPEVRAEFPREYDADDPGATNPVDLCAECASSFDDEMTCDHPPYEDAPEDGRYHCLMCGMELAEDDND